MEYGWALAATLEEAAAVYPGSFDTSHYEPANAKEPTTKQGYA